MAKVLGRNKHQKAAHRVGERRVGRDEIPELLELARSSDPEERLVAAGFLCPCHVRRRIEEVWEALYRLLEDPDVRVRRAAWHTLEDGGTPEDPALDAILARVRRTETDRQVLNLLRQVVGPRADREMHHLKALGEQHKSRQRGKCDFCARENVFVERDLQTILPAGGLMTRAALICEACAKSSGG